MKQLPAAAPLFSRLAALPFADKAAAGFGLMGALFFCAMILAGLGVHAARMSADAARNGRLPLMETALELEEVTYEATFHAAMFGVSGDMASYSAARIRFAALRDATAALAARVSGLPEGLALSRDVDILRNLAVRLDQLVEKKRTVNETLGAERAKLRRAADVMGETLTELQARTASATSDGRSDATLDEKAMLLVLNGFAMAVEEVAGRALAAGLTRPPDDLAQAVGYFTERWNEAREACRAAAALPASGVASARPRLDPGGEMDTQAALFRSIMRSILLSLEEAGRVSAERAEVTANLASVTRSMTARARAAMVEAMDRTDTALRGATAMLAVCALLACVLAGGSAALFFRSRKLGLPRDNARRIGHNHGGSAPMSRPAAPNDGAITDGKTNDREQP